MIGELIFTLAFVGREMVRPCCLLSVHVQVALGPPIRLNVALLKMLAHRTGVESASLTEWSNSIIRLDKSGEKNTSSIRGAL